MKNLSLKKMSEFLFALLFLIFLFDPGDNIFHAKIPIYILLIAILLLYNAKIKYSDIKFVLLFFIVPFFSAVVGALNGCDLNFIVEIVISFSLILMYIMFNVFNFNVVKLFCNCCVVLCLVIISLFVLTYFLSDGIISQLSNFGNSNVAFTIDKRIYAGVKFPNIYFHSSPMLIFPSVYFSYLFFGKKAKGSALKLLIITAGFFLTGTRANILLSFFVPISFWFYYAKTSKKIILIFLVVVLIISVFGILSAFFAHTDVSNNIKLGYFISYYEAFIENPLYLITGAGIGNTIFSHELNGNLNVTELTYMNFIYWFGFPLGIFFICVLLYPLFVKTKNYGWIKFAYLLFLAMNLVNPFIFSSNGMTILSISFYYIFNNKKEPLYERNHTCGGIGNKIVSPDNGNKQTAVTYIR